MTTSTLTLAQFLKQRLAEDEAAAQATLAAGDLLEWEDGESIAGPVDGPSGYTSVVIDPNRVLAEVAAKRAILQEWATFKAASDNSAESTSLPAALTAAGIVAGLNRAVGHLAAAYSDHPDYDQSWRP